MPTDTAASAIERALVLDILRGRHAVGTRLPTIRALAAAHGVTTATIQRVVSSLEARGLVVARHGSGLLVQDPVEAGDVSLVPLWLEALEDEPARAVAMLDDFLEMRRALAARLLVRHRAAIAARAPELAALAARMAAAASEGIDALREADLAFARALLRPTGNVLALSVLSTLQRLLTALPLVSRAMFAAPEENAASMLRVMHALASGGADASAIVETALAEVDARTVERFRQALDAQTRDAKTTRGAVTTRDAKTTRGAKTPRGARTKAGR